MTDVFLRDVLTIPESVHAGDFKVELTGGFTDADSAARVGEYVVTPQLREAFAKALTIVRAGVRDGHSHAAYLHGSFGSGKSHFLTVLHAVLNNHAAARAKPGLQPVIAEHDEWLRGKRFLMVPYHLIGATDLDSAILGGYVAGVRSLRPDAAVPPVYRSDAMLDDARRQREFLADDARFARWLGSGAPATEDLDDLDVIDGIPDAGWTTAELDAAFAARPGDPVRRGLESALLSGPMSAYARGATGDAAAFVPLENGLSVIAAHAKELGYDGVILFLDELILWLQSHMADQKFVNVQVGNLVKLIESGVAERALPIVSFISRQRDLSQLVGEDVTGADVKNLEAQVEYLAERFDVVNLEDRNLPAIIKERVLKPRPGRQGLLDEAFASIESAGSGDKDVLLDADGATGATWDDFRRVYPLSPALVNVLVALSGALQRERTGLKLLQEMLHRRRADMLLGQLIPLGDLWDVLADGTRDAFTDKLRREAQAAQRFHTRVRAYLLGRYGSETDPRFVADDRFVKTLLLASLTPNVPALSRLTGGRIAALNLGSIRSRTVAPGSMVVTRLRELQAEFGELRAEGETDPVFALHLADLDVEPLLNAVGERDTTGARRIWVKDQLWNALGVRDTGEFVCEREFVWRGTRRTAEFVFANVRDTADVPDLQFSPGVDGRVRFVLDYPFDVPHRYPSDDVQRVNTLRRAGLDAATVVWLPHFLSDQKMAQLGRLLKIEYLLDRDRLADHAGNLSTDDRHRIGLQLRAQGENLRSQLGAALQQAYGIAKPDKGTVIVHFDEGTNALSLLPGYAPRLAAGATFEHNAQVLVDGLFSTLYPRHPDFDPAGSRKPVTVRDLNTVLGWVTRAMEDGQRVTVDSKELLLVRRIVHGLELGEVSDGPLTLSVEWRRRIEQHAAAQGVRGDFPVEDIRSWITALGLTGLDRPVANLIIATYALLADRAWLHHGVAVDPPAVDRIGPGYALRAQELPSAEEFSVARQRAADLFGGKPVPDVLFARNVNRLATAVRATVTELEPAVNAVRRSLDKHAAALGSDGDRPSPRAATARHAAELLARLSATRDATPLVRELAATLRTDVTDIVLGSAIASAPAVLDALDATEWSLLESVRGFVGHEVLGERAERLVGQVADAARDDERVRELAPVLGGIRRHAVALIAEAGRLAAVSDPPPQVVGPVGVPPVTPSGRTRRVVRGSEIDAVLRELTEDLRARARSEPAARFELTWGAVEDSAGA